MLGFDDLFEKHDPYATFSLELESGEDLSQEGRVRVEGLQALSGLPQEERCRLLCDAVEGADLRYAALGAVKAKAVLVDVSEVLQVLAAQVALRQSQALDSPSLDQWVHEAAESAVEC